MRPAAQENEVEEPQSPQDREHLKVVEAERRRRAIRLGAVIGLVVLFLIFVVRNSQPAPVDFIFFERRPRLIWIMVACGVIGGIVGYILGRPGKTTRFHRKNHKDDKKKAA